MERASRKSIITTLLTVFACILAVVAVFVFIPMSTKTNAENEPSVWDGDLVAAGWGVEHTAPVDGKASEEAPSTKPSGYVATFDEEDDTKVATVTISDAASLAYFAREIYEFSANYEGCKVALKTDIDLNNKLWMPIGLDNRTNKDSNNVVSLYLAFKGSFDGENHTISNLNGTKFAEALVNKTVDDNEKLFIEVGDNSVFVPSDGNEYSYGLFGATANITIKNIKLSQFTLDGTRSTATISGDQLEPDSVGLIGFAGGSVTVENCVVGTPKTEANKDVVDIVGTRVTGGIIGRAYLAITGNGGFGSSGTFHPIIFKDCTNYLNIGKVGDAAQKGGILGFNSGVSKLEFENCKNYGNIIGQYVGGITSFSQQGTASQIELMRFEKCTNEGNVTSTDRFAGGIIGSINSLNMAELRMIDCVNKGDITSITNPANSTNEQVTGGIAGAVTVDTTIGPVWKSSGGVYVKDRDGYATQFTAEKLFNYGTIRGAKKSNESKSVIAYSGGIFGHVSASQGHYTSQYYFDQLAKYEKGEISEKPAYPYTVIQFNTLVNCGEVTCDDFNNVYGTTNQYVGSILGAIPSGVVSKNNLTKIEAETFVSAYGKIKPVEFVGRHADKVVGAASTFDWERQPSEETVPTAEVVTEGTKIIGVNTDDIDGDFKVVIPSGITEIAPYAFLGYGTLEEKGHCALTSGYTVAHDQINDVNTKHLVSVEFAANSTLETIGEFAFAGTDIGKIELPTSVKTIGRGAFADTKLETVKLNSAELTVADMAFGNNSYLKQVELAGGNMEFGTNVFNNRSDKALYVIADKSIYDSLKTADVDFKALLTYVVTIEYYDFSTGSALKVGEEKRLHGAAYTVVLNADGVWANNSNISYVGLSSLNGANTPWYASSSCSGASLSPSAQALADLLNGNSETVKLYTRAVGESDEFVAVDNLVFGREYPLGAINALLAPRSKKVTTEAVAITAYNGSSENLKTSIYDAGVYTVTITPESGEATTLTITVLPATVELSASGVFQWRVSGATLSDGPVYLADGNPTLVKPESGNYTVEAAIESLVRVRNNTAQTLSLTGTGFTANVQQGSTAQGTAIGKYTTTYTLTADSNHVFALNGTVVNGSARGLTVTLDENVATVTKVWYIVDIGNWLVDNNGDDYAIADRVYGSNATFAAPHFRFGDSEASRNAIVYTLTREGYNGLEFAPADFAKYLNNTIPVGRYTLRISAPEVRYYEEYDEETNEPVGDPVVYPAFKQEVTFEVTAATLTSDQGINGYLNGSAFGYLLGETGVSETNLVTVNSINGAIENIYNNFPSNDSSYWGSASRPVIEVTLVSDKTNVYSAFTRPDAVGVYNYYYRIRIDNYNIIDSDAQGEPLGFTLTVYGIVELPIISAHQYTGALQVAFIADSEQYRVVRNNGGIDAGTYEVEVELIHPECYIWVDQTLAGEHSASRTVGFVIEQAANAWTRLPNIVNWSYDSFDADVNRIRAVPLYLNTGAELYFKVATDEEGANVINGLDHITVDRNGKISDTTVIGLLNGLTVGRYYLVSVVDETANYSSMVQSIGFNVTKATNYWASGESDLVLPSWVVGDYDPTVNTIAVNPEHGVANIRVIDFNGVEYYNSVTGVNNLAEAPVGKYLLIAWVDASDNFEALAERTFTIEVLETIGLPWWGTLLIVIGVLVVVAIVLFVLWKKGVFQILTGKLVLAIRTAATVDATIAAVRASKKADEAKAAIAAAKAKERASERRAKAAAERALPVEERAAALEAKAQVAAAKADKMRARAEAMQARADRMKEEANGKTADTEAVEQPTEPAPTSEAEAAATETEE